MRTFAVALAGLALLAFSPAHADEADGIDCAHAMTQQDMNICADKDYRRADAELNRVYRKTIAGQDGHSRDLLRASERAWIGFRDAQCRFESAENEGGTIYPLVYGGCLTALTMARTKQLKEGQR
jgi:uncharacterized protein YecT (DUF1311 family)